MEYRTYNTGDQIWVRRTVDGQLLTVKLVTSDGLKWEEGELGLTKMEGPERFLHYFVVGAIRFNHWLMNA
jgi:hypothetical protein